MQRISNDIIQRMKSSLKQFEPEKVAALELNMWRAYYNHNFFRLFFLLRKLIKTQFHLGGIDPIKAAYYAASAAIQFRLQRGKENKKKISGKLISFFEIIAKNGIEAFDHRKVAELELEWWLVDRYPERYYDTREQALAAAMAMLYNVEPERLAIYARNRAEAMVLQDKAETENKEADWQKIGALLKESYVSLYESVNYRSSNFVH